MRPGVWGGGFFLYTLLELGGGGVCHGYGRMERMGHSGLEVRRTWRGKGGEFLRHDLFNLVVICSDWPDTCLIHTSRCLRIKNTLKNLLSVMIDWRGGGVTLLVDNMILNFTKLSYLVAYMSSPYLCFNT